MRFRRLSDILDGNLAKRASSLPLVHTTAAYFLQQIITTGAIEPRPCDVFAGEKLSYFFVGRPAYKSIGRDIMHWELPSCIIAEFDKPSPKRTFPFDSGAFSRGILPRYATMIEMDDYELGPDADLIHRYIGTFFGNSEKYFLGEAIEKGAFLQKHGILPTETAIHALLSVLNGERIPNSVDERRSSIEKQFDTAIKLENSNIKAVIIPQAYLKDRDFIRDIESKGIQIITYPVLPVNSDHYNFAIYERCYNFYNENGYFDV